MSAGIPVSIRKLLWDADVRALDLVTHQRLIVERVLNYGTLADWRWIVARYGVGAIRALLSERAGASRSAIRDEARHLASLILR